MLPSSSATPIGARDDNGGGLIGFEIRGWFRCLSNHLCMSRWPKFGAAWYGTRLGVVGRKGVQPLDEKGRDCWPLNRFVDFLTWAAMFAAIFCGVARVAQSAERFTRNE